MWMRHSKKEDDPNGRSTHGKTAVHALYSIRSLLWVRVTSVLLAYARESCLWGGLRKVKLQERKRGCVCVVILIMIPVLVPSSILSALRCLSSRCGCLERVWCCTQQRPGLFMYKQVAFHVSHETTYSTANFGRRTHHPQLHPKKSSPMGKGRWGRNKARMSVVEATKLKLASNSLEPRHVKGHVKGGRGRRERYWPQQLSLVESDLSQEFGQKGGSYIPIARNRAHFIQSRFKSFGLTSLVHDLRLRARSL